MMLIIWLLYLICTDAEAGLNIGLGQQPSPFSKFPGLSNLFQSNEPKLAAPQLVPGLKPVPGNFPDPANMFPNHMDFHKVASITSKGVEYKLLRPTVHTMKDHFNAVMTKKSNDEFPTKKVYMDDNGFRHYWSGFEEIIRNLRRNEDKAKENDDEDKADATDTNTEQTTEGNDETETTNTKASNREGETTDADQVTTDADTQNTQASESSTAAESNPRAAKSSTVAVESSTVAVESSTVAVESSTAASVAPTTKPKKKTKRKKPKKLVGRNLVYAAKPDLRWNDNLILNPDDKSRTLVKTTFFCPYIGVLTMHSYLDS